MTKGVGPNNVNCSLQVKCPTIVLQGLTFNVTYHVLPDECLSEDILLGRDILEEGISIEISNGNVTFTKAKVLNSCSKLEPFDVTILPSN